MYKISCVIIIIVLSVICFPGCGTGKSERSALVLTTQTSQETAGDETDGETAKSIVQTVESGTATTSGLSSDAPVSPVLSEQPAPDPEIVVHVCGAVNREGVYTLKAGSRVYEAVAAAGGFAPDADETWINQAEILSDGVRLMIPTISETAVTLQDAGNGAALTDTGLTGGAVAGISGGSSTDGSAATGGKVNINTADAETLCTLTGVGPGTAAKIIAYREEYGGFQTIEDIMQVKGIKEKTFANIQDDITVR